MKIVLKIGALLILPAVFLASCKKGPEIRTLTVGNFGSDAAALKSATDIQIGAAISYNPIINDAKYSEIVKRDFDAVTFDYNMKHGAIVQDNGTLNFTNADAMVNACTGLEIFGHTLGWHQNQNATYLKSFAGITVPAATELLVNGNFEGGTATTFSNWSTYNAQAGATINVTTVASEIRSGTRALKAINLVGDPAAQYKLQLASDLFNTVSGTQYNVTYWVKAASGSGSIRLSTQTAGGGSAQYQGDQTIGSSAFTQISWTFTANSPQTRILFDMAAAANTYFIDDASVKEVIAVPSGSQVAAKLDIALGNFITGMVNKYKSRVHAWDVVNELFADDGNIRNNNNTPNTAADVLVWSNYMGRDYALKAFNYAKAADPTADLYINDYSLESRPAKRDSLIAFVAELKNKGAKVDGIGTQMHIAWNADRAGIDAAFQKLAATGLKIRISELDVKTVNGSSAGTPTPQLLSYQAEMVKYVISSYLKYVPTAQRGGITVWGVTDNTSWLYNNGTEYPLLYDKNYGKKPSYAAFLQALGSK